MQNEQRRDLLKIGGAALAAGVLGSLGLHARAAEQEGRTKGAQAPSAPQRQAEKTPIVAVGSAGGVVRWLQPKSAQELGEGALLNIKIDRLSVPHTTMMIATQKLAASGIPVHSHTWEDEMIYVLTGHGFAIINEEQTSVPIDTGSVLYIPMGEWHGLKNADPKAPMDILLVTTPVKPSGLGDFFRFATVQPGHPPLNLPEKEFLMLVRKYGMEVPKQK
ncbi:MAG TPA: cupin domain-containing protein [Candidatus Tectomicrobia bacterium]|nr:cupin domain-containing protein [Candidatus Tectomicrobia bacterium]